MEGGSEGVREGRSEGERGRREGGRRKGGRIACSDAPTFPTINNFTVVVG